jgi:hypothetical protein
MTDGARRPEQVERVREVVVHFVKHWPGPERDLAAKTAEVLVKMEAASGHGIPGGRSAKALSAWKIGRQLPEDARILIALRRAAGCRCIDRLSGFTLYRDGVLYELWRAAKQTDTTNADPRAEQVALDQVRAVSAAAAEDCDVVANGLRLHDVYVPRDLEHTIVETIRPRTLTAVRGEAGYGKTALMWRLRRRLEEAGWLSLLIPATALLRGARGDRDPGAVTVDQLWAALRVAVRQHRRPVLLVDTVDLLTHSDETRVEVHRLMRTAVECRVPMLVACRPAEAALLHLDTEADDTYGVPIRPLYLGPFNRRERADAIKAYATTAYRTDSAKVVATVQDAQVRGRPLLEVVANPLTLRMLFELYSGDGERPDVDIDSIGLYTLMWQRRVVTDRRDRATPGGGPDLSVEAERIALAMLNEGRIDLKRSELITWLDGVRSVDDALERLEARAVITLRQETHRLRFWHQTWFEYSAARAVARSGEPMADELTDFVAQAPYDLFFGEVASQLILLAGRTALVTLELAERLLTSWLQNDTSGLPALALRTYARFRTPSPTLQAHASTALRAADERVCKDFLRLLPSVSHPDPERWLGDLAVTWKRTELRISVIDALVRLAAADPAAAARFVTDHDCLSWLLKRKVEQWRDHDSPHIRLLNAVAPADPTWAAHQVMRFWPKFAEAGIGGGLADIVRFVAHHNAGDTAHMRTISASLRALRTTSSTVDLQVAYADLAVAAGQLPDDVPTALNEALREDADQIWRRARLRTVGRAALALTEPDGFLQSLLSAEEPTELDHRATVLAELLRGPGTAGGEPPATRWIRLACRSALGLADTPPALTAMFVTGIRYARLNGATLAGVLPDSGHDPKAWFNQLDPLLVDAAAVRAGGAEAALRWAVTDEARPHVNVGKLRGIGTLLKDRVENAPHLLTHVVAIARVTLNTAPLCETLDRLPADLTADQPEALYEIRRLRDELVQLPAPQSTKGYTMWRALVRNGLDTPIEPDMLAQNLAATKDPRLRNALLGLALEIIERDAWEQQDVSSLTAQVKTYLSGRQSLDALTRQVLVGLLARIAPLPEVSDDRLAYAEQVIAYVFGAGYDVTEEAGVHAFTPCLTLLGWLVHRLIPIDRRDASRVLVAIVDRLHALHPDPVHWRQSLAVRWRYTVMALIEALPARERKELTETLFQRDQYMVADALVACVTREQIVAPWILKLVEKLPDGARGRLRSTLFEHARERSHRRLTIALPKVTGAL